VSDSVANPAAATGTVGSNEPVRRPPAARLHSAEGASVVREAGWELVSSYGDVSAERAVLRESVGVVDVTPRGKIDLRGRIDDALSNGAGRAEIVVGIADTWAVILRPPGPVADRVAKLEAAAGGAAMVTDVTHLYAGYALAGPEVPEVLARLTSFDADSLEPGGGTGAPIAEVRAVWARRDLEVPAVEVYVAAEFGRYAWRTFVDAVRARGGAPVGWEALRAEGWN
jgi:sarcosine oxidase, subunit alpha